MLSVKEKLAPICVTAITACLLALAGCGSDDGLTGGVAATVNGTDIAEDKVTNYIMDLRTAQSVTNDKDWANWLNTNGYTPSSLREAVVNMYITQELEQEAAKDAGVEVTDDEVDAVVESMKSNYDTDEAWQNALSSAGLTEESYRDNVYQPMLEEKLLDAVIDEKDAKADDDTILSYAQMYAPQLDGSKRSSHILFAADDEETAQKVLDELNNGADFAELAKEYSTDTASAENGGDVGWSGLNSFVTAYSDALDQLDKGETSGLVTSEFGIHIIRVTDVWKAPESITKLSQVPDEVIDVIRTQMADPAAKQTAYSNYLQELKDKAEIHINDMPNNVPYNVDMDKYISSSTAEDDSDDADGADDADDADGDDANADEEADAQDSADDEEEVVIDGSNIEVEGDSDAEAEVSADDANDDATDAAAEAESDDSDE